jgi:plastocyanin
MNFALPNITIPVGTAITWRNDDMVAHTVTSGRDGQFDRAGWDSPVLAAGQTFNQTLTKIGAFAYTCRIHPSLNATVTVTQSGTPSFTFLAPAPGSGGYSGY